MKPHATLIHDVHHCLCVHTKVSSTSRQNARLKNLTWWIHVRLSLECPLQPSQQLQQYQHWSWISICTSRSAFQPLLLTMQTNHHQIVSHYRGYTSVRGALAYPSSRWCTWHRQSSWSEEWQVHNMIEQTKVHFFLFIPISLSSLKVCRLKLHSQTYCTQYCNHSMQWLQQPLCNGCNNYRFLYSPRDKTKTYFSCHRVFGHLV